MACRRILGSKTKIALFPQLECESAPLVQRVEVAAAAIVDAEIVSLKVPATYTPPGGAAYTAATTLTVYKNTILYVGTAQTPVTVLEDYVLTNTAQNVKVKPLTAALASADTADSYLSGQVCVTSATASSPAQTVATNENCGEGLLTQAIVGFNRTLAITGLASESASFWNLLVKQGKDLGYLLYYLDYAKGFGEYGTVQISIPDFTNNDATNVLGFTIQGQIQNFTMAYPKGQLTVAQLAVENTRRKLYGLPLYA